MALAELNFLKMKSIIDKSSEALTIMTNEVNRSIMNNQNIETLLTDAATIGKSSDYERLFLALKGVELFFNVTTEGSEGQAVSTPLVRVGPCLNAVLLCTSKNSDKLTKPFGGIQWERALQMVLSVPLADGMVIQGIGTAWIGLDKAKVESLLRAIS